MKQLVAKERMVFESVEMVLMFVMICLAAYSTAATPHRELMPPSYAINVSLDLYGMVMIFIMYHSVALDRMDVNKYRTNFLVILFIQHIALFSDVYAWLLQGVPEYAMLNRLTNTVFYLVGPLLTMAFYVYVRISTDYENRYVHGLDTFVSFITLVACILVVTNIFTGIYFTVDEAGFYVRNYPYMLCSYIFPLLTLVATVLLLVPSKLKMWEKITLSTYFLFPCLFVYIQAVTFGLSIMYIATLLATFLIYSKLYLYQSRITMENSYEIAKRDAVIANTRNKLVMAQIRPEFIYTGMQKMRELTDDKPDQAVEILDSFMGYIVSAISNMGEEGTVPISEELDFTKYYLECVKAKCLERLDYHMDTCEQEFEIPPLIIEPIVEVIVNRGLAILDSANDSIHISFFQKEGAYCIQIEDSLAYVNVENCTDDKMASVLERAHSYGIKIGGGSKPSGGSKIIVEVEANV